jgi:hypothetical protein
MGTTARLAGAARAGFVTMAGGVVMILGTFLPFVRVATSFPGVPTQNVSGLDTDDGKLFLAFGAGIAVFGLIILLTRGVIPRVMGVLALLGGGFMGVAGIIDLTSFGDEALREVAAAAAAETPGTTTEQVLQLFQQLGVTLDPGIGLYVVLAGTLISVIGGVWAILTRTSAPVPAAPPPPGTATGWATEATTPPLSEPARGTEPPPAPGEPPEERT